jgi:hypothetical protein
LDTAPAAQSQELTRQAIESVFDAVYKKKVPRELVQHYESTVFDRKFFRRNDEYIYTLRVPHGARSEDFITVAVFHKFEMQNLTKSDLEFEFTCETSLPPGGSTKQKPKYFELRVNKKPVAVGDGEIVQCPGYDALVLKHKVNIAAEALLPFRGPVRDGATCEGCGDAHNYVAVGWRYRRCKFRFEP